MGKFKVSFVREVHTYDRVEREIEASSEEQAEEIAASMASQFNMNSPDDATEGDPICDDWEIDEIEEAGNA